MDNRRRSETKMEQYQIIVTILSPKAAGPLHKNFDDNNVCMILAKEFYTYII